MFDAPPILAAPDLGLPQPMAPRAKPTLRGVSHQAGFYVSLLAGTLLISWAPPGAATQATAIYALCVSTLFGASALYHRPHWSPMARARMRRVDHAAIYLLIAGTYTPIAMLAVPQEAGRMLLSLAWGGAAFGIVKTLAWPRAPKWVTALVYVLFSWLVVVQWDAVASGLGPAGLGLILAGGAMYTGGALIYAKRRPDPWPQVFGYHEIFHALVVLAAACHFAAIVRLATGER